MAVNRQRQMIGTMVSTLYLDHRTLSMVRTTIDRLIESYGESAVFKTYHKQHDDTGYMGLFAPQLESDYEMQRRIASEERAERATQTEEQRDLAEFERLKAKFG